MSSAPAKIRHPEAPGLRLRVVVRQDVALGPGRADLLQNIQERGSIAAAGRAMGMSYRRAWMLVNATSVEFGAPVVTAAAGGASGGKARLTELGLEILDLYRLMEAKAAEAVAAELFRLRALAERGSTSRPD